MNSIKKKLIYNNLKGLRRKGINEDKVLKSKDAHGLKQSPRDLEMDSKIDQYFQDNNFMKYINEHALYVKKNEHGYLISLSIFGIWII